MLSQDLGPHAESQDRGAEVKIRTRNRLVKSTWSLEPYFYVIELVLSVVLIFLTVFLMYDVAC